MKHYLLLSFMIATATLTVSCKSSVEERTQIVIQSLASHFKDPESVKVRNLVFYKGGKVCGQVDAKNSFGGYTGYTNFVGKLDSIAKTFTVTRIGALEPYEAELLEFMEKQGKRAEEILPDHFCWGEREF